MKNSASPQSVQVVSFYQFRAIEASQVSPLAEKIEIEGRSRGLVGLVIFGVEGINATLSGERAALERFIQDLEVWLALEPLALKWSEARKPPFHRFQVKIRDEIVTLGTPDLRPDLAPALGGKRTHLTPEEWHQVLVNDKNFRLIDTRNWYETRLGKFAGAVDPNIDEFTEFPEYIKKQDIKKDEKVLIYCTGGIRCEKAILEMNRQGFENVYQLEGGILAYLERFPNAKFEGECFVFDHRVAVDQNLQPSQQFKLCPHCGQPADQKLACARCDTDTMVCVTCVEVENLRTCSKNCAHHYARSPGKKGRQQRQGLRFEGQKVKPQKTQKANALKQD